MTSHSYTEDMPEIHNLTFDLHCFFCIRLSRQSGMFTVILVHKGVNIKTPFLGRQKEIYCFGLIISGEPHH